MYFSRQLYASQSRGLFPLALCLPLILGLSLLFFAVSAHTAQVELTWDASSDSNVAGYNVYKRKVSQDYTKVDSTGDTSYLVSGLNEGETYYFAVTAYATDETSESDYSNVVSTTIPIPAPKASFSADPTSGPAPLIVRFNDTSTGNIDNRSWDFGDGSDSIAETAIYTYKTAGTYTVTLTVDGPGGEDKETKSITVTESTSDDDTGDDDTGDDDTGDDGGSGGSGIGGTTTGLVAAYGFEEADDDVVMDASGNVNDGIIEGAKRTNQGRFGRALAFDGKNDRVIIPDDDSLDLTTGMTLEAWVYPTQKKWWRNVLIKEYSNEPVYYLFANTYYDATVTAINTGSGADTYLLGRSKLPVNAWTHLATTYDGSMQRLYVNGVEVASRARTGSIVPSDDVLSIGGDSISGKSFKGYLDEIRIYNRALTDNEIQADMESPVVD